MTQLGLGRHTLLNAVLLSTTLALLLLNTLDTLIEVVLGGGALGRVLALCLCVSMCCGFIVAPGREAVVKSLAVIGTELRVGRLTNLPRGSPSGQRAPPRHPRPPPPLLPLPPPRARPWNRSWTRSPPATRQYLTNRIRKPLYAPLMSSHRN